MQSQLNQGIDASNTPYELADTGTNIWAKIGGTFSQSNGAVSVQNRKTKKSSHNTATNELEGSYSAVTPPDTVHDAQSQDDAGGDAGMMIEEDTTTSEPQKAGLVGHSQDTPIPGAANEEEGAPPNSPLSPPQNHLQATIRGPNGFYRSALSPLANRDVNPESTTMSRPESPRTNRTVSRGQTLRSGDKTDVNYAFHHVSECPSSPKVSKSKALRRSAAPAASQRKPTDEDYVQILRYLLRRREEKAVEEFAVERKNLQGELQHVLAAKQNFQDELNTAQQQNSSLVATVNRQNSNAKTYESKVNKLKTFLKGLGNDFDALKKDANATRRNCEELATERDDWKTQRDALAEQWKTCADQSARLKNETLTTCRETQKELQDVLLHTNYQERRLSENAGLLTEERDRRAEFEKRLASVVGSDEKFLEILKSNNDAVIEEINKIHVTIQDRAGSDESSVEFEKILAAIQSLNCQPAASVHEIDSVKCIVGRLSERYAQSVSIYETDADLSKSITRHLDSNTFKEQKDYAVASAFRKHLDEALGQLKEELADQSKHVHQEAAQVQAVNVLQEKLRECEVQVVNATKQLSDAQAAEVQLREQNAALEANITTLRNTASPMEIGQARVNEVEAELTAKAQAHESTKADLASKEEEMRALSSFKANLEDRVESLQKRLEEAQSNAREFGPEREELKRKTQAEVERVRKEMASHTDSFEAELRTQTSNEVKKLTSERNRLEKRLKPLSEELAASRARIQELEVEKEKKAESAGRERLTMQIQSYKQEIETLQTSLKEAHESRQQELFQEKSKLLKQIEDLRHTADEAKQIEEQAKAKLTKYLADKEKTITQLEKEKSKAQKEAGNAAAGLETFNESCKKAINDANAKGERQIKALQQRVLEAEAELRKKNDEIQRYRAEVEQSWQEEQQGLEGQAAEIRAKLAEVEAQRDEALEKNDRIHKELQKVTDEQLNKYAERGQHAENAFNSQHQPSSQGSKVLSRLRVPNFNEDTTPNAPSQGISLPPKPRKGADRHSNITVDVGPVPAPEGLRADYRKANSIMAVDHIPDPIVEESQVHSEYFPSGSHAARSASAKPPLTMSSDNDDMLTFKGDQPQNLPETVEETQFENTSQSFKAFNSTTTPPRASNAKATSSMPPISRIHQSKGDSRESSQGGIVAEAAHNPPLGSGVGGRFSSEGFAIYEDSRGVVDSLKSQDVQPNRRQDYGALSRQAKIEDYTFRKPFPPSNSASKRVHVDSEQSNRVFRDGSNTLRNLASRERTANVRGETSMTPGAGGRPSSISSSPAFTHAKVASSRKISTYKASGGSGGERDQPKTDLGSTMDPRLVGWAPPVSTKRQAERHVVEGYETERKKRLSRGVENQLTNTNSSSLHSRAQSATSHPAQISRVAFGAGGSRNSRGVHASQSRMRNLAGGSSRTTRGVKKLSKRKLIKPYRVVR